MRWLPLVLLLVGCGRAEATSYRASLPLIADTTRPPGYVFPQPEPTITLSGPLTVPYTQASARVYVRVGTVADPVAYLPITLVYTRPRAGAYATDLIRLTTDGNGESTYDLPVAGDVDPAGAPEGKVLHVLARYDQPADTTHWFFSRNWVITPY